MPERGGLDPRTKILTVALTSVVVLAPGGTRFVPAGLLLGIGLALAERAWLRAAALPLAAGVLACAVFLLPQIASGAFVTIIVIGSSYALRFVVVAGVAMHLVATVPPTRMTAAFRAWHLPRALSVTSSVLLRFVPVVAAETRAVIDAMRLRGLAGPGAMLRHPILAIERFAVPVIASTLRVGEDLSASAILRGLGSPHRPTSMHPPRLTWSDALFALSVGALAVASILIVPGVA